MYNQPTTQPRPNVMQQSASLFNQAAKGPDVFGFMNPYTQQVVNTSMADLNRGRQMALNQIGADATQAGAFGGSRHGVAEALTNTGFAQEAAQMAAGLRSQGFNTAMDNAFRNQAMQSQLAGQGFGFGQALNQQQMQQGAMQQQLMQQLIDAAKGQYQGYIGAPMAGLNLINAMLPANGGSTTTSTSSPGLFGVLSSLL